jgi:hypothetical protein
MWRCGVGPAIGQRLEANTPLAKRIQDVEQVAGRAGQPIQPRHMKDAQRDAALAVEVAMLIADARAVNRDA